MQINVGQKLGLLGRLAAMVLFLTVTAVPAAFAAALNLNSSGVAIMGYDPVAYFKGDAPVKGDPGLTASHDGAVYWFSSEENRAEFVAMPARFVPAYGGYCAYGVSQGVKVPIDPEAFAVVDDTLYLNITKKVQRTWEKDIPGYIKMADEKWPALAN